MNAATEFDVFVSYNTLDHAAVERIARAFKDRDLTVFLDRWELVPGRPWPDALEEHLSRSRSAVVVLGPSGMGPWQQREYYLALDRQVRDTTFGVIPVILPNANPALGFLSLNTWVDLRGGVDDTQSFDLLAAAVRGQPPAALLERTREAVAGLCPYRGLEVFREEDAPFFFGREDFTKKLRGAVAAQSLVAVVGSSGSGKSSVVRAGLIPSLRRSAGTVWEVVILVPGQHPLHALIGALLPLLEPDMTEMDRLVEVNKQAEHLRTDDLHLHQVIKRVVEKQQGTDRLLLVIDQWEELYTYAKDEEAEKVSARFVDELLTTTETAPLTVVLTLRADFYGEALAHRGLSDQLQAAQVNLGPMTREELERAVTAPAEKVGLSFDPGLVDRLLDDVGEEPGNLPLLEYALKELWSARRGSHLLYKAYKSMRGVKGAIAQRAESVYKTLDSRQKKTAERVFTRLVRPGEESGDARRRAVLNEFDEVGRTMVRTLAGPKARLLITSRDTGTNQETVEVAHEALIREWGRLRPWVDKVRKQLRDQALMEDLARTWKEHGSGLASGRQLRDFRRAGAPSKMAEKFLDASLRRIHRRIAVTAVVSILLASVLVGFNLWISNEEMSPAMGFYVLVGKAGKIIKEPEMVEIHPGEGVFPKTFWMGSPDDDPDARSDEKPRHRVRFMRPFAIGRYEVTFDEYELFARLSGRPVPSAEGWGKGDRPVINVSWKDAVAYAQWLKEETKKPYRLPTEAEWEYAARAGTETRWSFGEEESYLEEYAWGRNNSDAKTHPAGEKEPNPWGIHDVHGNVYEWVADCWHKDYSGSPPTDGSAWEESDGGNCRRRVVRGGSWNYGPRDLRSAGRSGGYTGHWLNYLGFRLAQDI